MAQNDSGHFLQLLKYVMYGIRGHLVFEIGKCLHVLLSSRNDTRGFFETAESS